MAVTHELGHSLSLSHLSGGVSSWCHDDESNPQSIYFSSCECVMEQDGKVAMTAFYYANTDDELATATRFLNTGMCFGSAHRAQVQAACSYSRLKGQFP